MNRLEFTANIIQLLKNMILNEEHPILDFCKRSDEEQKRLFDAGLSKCDGIKIRSRHQDGCAVDIYFIEENKISEPKLGFGYWHEEWERLGGGKYISWDLGHWEG